ncbi:hypothetical protein VNO77_03587 [Canavalia gladiata]|uniref:Uncharacterized protein n=1 Tax=Canavalia gladiata TaxID=3824 RepID=A0AAN9RCD5_CANGL
METGYKTEKERKSGVFEDFGQVDSRPFSNSLHFRLSSFRSRGREGGEKSVISYFSPPKVLHEKSTKSVLKKHVLIFDDCIKQGRRTLPQFNNSSAIVEIMPIVPVFGKSKFPRTVQPLGKLVGRPEYGLGR